MDRSRQSWQFFPNHLGHLKCFPPAYVRKRESNQRRVLSLEKSTGILLIMTPKVGLFLFVAALLITTTVRSRTLNEMSSNAPTQSEHYATREVILLEKVATILAAPFKWISLSSKDFASWKAEMKELLRSQRIEVETLEHANYRRRWQLEPGKSRTCLN